MKDTTDIRVVMLSVDERCACGRSASGATSSAGLSFIDLLYAVPVAYLATRLGEAQPSAVTASGWADVAVALTAVTFGWVGHHTNRRKLPDRAIRREERTPFTTARFPQFIVEILIIAVYFALVRVADLPGHTGPGVRSELVEVGWLTTAFWFYLAWDFLDVYIATTPIDPPLRGYEERWATRAVSGMYVTLAFTLFFSCIWYFVWTKRQHPVHTIVAFDLAMLILLLAYRITQEKRHPAQEKKQATGRVDGDRSTSTSVGVRH